jgi:hypothetical protein
MHVIKYYKAVVYLPFIVDQHSGFLDCCFFDRLCNCGESWLIQWTCTAVFVNCIVALTFYMYAYICHALYFYRIF